MNPAEFDDQFNRLTAHFHLPPDESRETLALDWLKALEHHHIDAFEHAVTELTKTATDRYWPALGKINEIIAGRRSRYDRTPGKCATCHGSTWIEAQPWKSNGIIYDGNQRCPDCGIPAPQSHDHKRVHGLTPSEFHDHHAGRSRQNLMPPGLEAKHPEKPGNPELRQMIAAFRAKFANKDEEIA